MEISTLELKRFNNISCQTKRLSTEFQAVDRGPDWLLYKDHLGLERHIRNFHEFYIDGEMLIKRIGQKFWNTEAYEPFFENTVGLLGSFGRFWDEIKINELFNYGLSKLEILEIASKHNIFDSETIQVCIKELESSQNEQLVLLYGCQQCGDPACGGLGVRITQDHQFYCWTFDEGPAEAVFLFEKAQYEQVFKEYLAS